jgi:hypothetical protein
MAAAATILSGHVLAREIAIALDATVTEVFDQLCTLPDNVVLPMLSSPDGWRTLAVFVAGRLDRDPPSYSPTVH